METVRSYCPLCRSMCFVVYHVENDRVVKVTQDSEAGPGAAICPKGRAIPEMIDNPQRLKWPLKRTRLKGDADPGWVRISWDEALEISAIELHKIKTETGPEAVAFYRPAKAGSPSSDYESFVVRLASYFGSPNTLSTGHICQWVRDSGSRYTFGEGGFPQPDLKRTKGMLIWGFNPARTWLNMYLNIEEARKRGGKLIVVDPRRTELAEKADVWLQPRPGSDAVLALGLIHVLLKDNLFDEIFARRWTNGPLLMHEKEEKLLRENILGGSEQKYLYWDEAQREAKAYDPEKAYWGGEDSIPALWGDYELSTSSGDIVQCKTVLQQLKDMTSGYTPEEVERITWIEARKIRQAALMLTKTKPFSYFTYNGIEQQTNAMQTGRAIAILFALTGNLDAPGGNVYFPKIKTNSLEALSQLGPEQVAKRLGLKERPLGPPLTRRVQAYEVYKAIFSQKPYPIRGLASFGGNLILANGESDTGRKAIQKLDFFLQTELYMTPAAQQADIVLPACTPFEYSFTRIIRDGENACAIRRPMLVSRRHECRPDPEIAIKLADQLQLKEAFWSFDHEALKDYELEPIGLKTKDLQNKPGGRVNIPLTTEWFKYKKQNGFKTPTRLVEIFSTHFSEYGYPPLPKYEEGLFTSLTRQGLIEKFPLVLTNTKLSYYCHGQHRVIPSLRKRAPHPFVEIHPSTAKEFGIDSEQWVQLETPYGSIKVVAKITDRVHPQVVVTQHGWWQSCPELGLPGYDPFSAEGSNINLLVRNDAIDPITGSVPHKAQLCTIKKL